MADRTGFEPAWDSRPARIAIGCLQPDSATYPKDKDRRRVHDSYVLVEPSQTAGCPVPIPGLPCAGRAGARLLRACVTLSARVWLATTTAKTVQRQRPSIHGQYFSLPAEASILDLPVQSRVRCQLR